MESLWNDRRLAGRSLRKAPGFTLGAPIGSLVLAAIASYIPAQRAASIDPIAALRAE